DSYPVLPIFTLMQKKGEIDEKIMYNTFNMGIGMVLAVDSANAEKAVCALKAAGEDAYVIGDVVSGSQKGVELC
ncbi:MAG: phosphoribosylformylglycinamidine cyclo-ligase, partial [Lachnospiraceae bacterium]|nr:phosphoribosylformylglycinamidine cyclo-ligase [Lachnospiraceae bacterium]